MSATQQPARKRRRIAAGTGMWLGGLVDDERTSREVISRMISQLKMGASDMGQAARAAALLVTVRADSPGRMHGDAEVAVATGAILAYARPFTRRGRDGALDEDEWAPDDLSQALLHKALIELRKARYAHANRTDARGSSDDVTSPAFSVGISAGIWARIRELAKAQEERMQAFATRLEQECPRTCVSDG